MNWSKIVSARDRQSRAPLIAALAIIDLVAVAFAIAAAVRAL